MRFENVETFRRWHCHTQSATDSICAGPASPRFALVHENPSTCRVAYATEMKCLRFGLKIASLGFTVTEK